MRHIITLLIVVCGLSCFAQENDVYPGTPLQTVMVEYFNTGYGIRRQDYQFVDYIRDKAISGICGSNRVKMLNAADYVDLRADDSHNYQSQSDYMRHRYEVMSGLGATFVLECDISRIDAMQPKRNDPWKGSFGCTLRLINATNGNVIARKTLDPKYNTGTGDTPEKAISNACDHIYSSAKTLILDNVMIQGQLLKIASLKKDIEAKEVYINLGPDNGALNGAKFQVYEVSSVAGREISKKIGEVKITNNEGGQISLAKVTKGGKEIKTAMDNGSILKLVSNQAGFWD